LKKVRIPVELPGNLATVLRESHLAREVAWIASRSGIWIASMVRLY
jgi:hypothetical protein